MTKFKVGDLVRPTKEAIARREPWIYSHDGKWPAKVVEVEGFSFWLEGKQGRWGYNGIEKAKPMYMENK